MFDVLTAMAWTQCNEETRPGTRLFNLLWHWQRRTLATRTPTGRATGLLFAHNASKQTATIDAFTPMESIGQMIGLVRRAPYALVLAGAAEMCGLIANSVRHLAPIAIADPAKIAAQVACHNLYAARSHLVAHRVHPCNTSAIARPCAIRKTANR
jgi:hypothetical protein